MFSFNQDITAKDLGGGVTRKVLTYSDNLMACGTHVSEGGSRGAAFPPPRAGGLCDLRFL